MTHESQALTTWAAAGAGSGRVGQPRFRGVTHRVVVGYASRARLTHPTTRRTASGGLGLLGRRLGVFRFLEDDDVLPGEEFERLLELVPLGLDLAAGLF